MKMRVFALLAGVLAVCAGLMVSCKKEEAAKNPAEAGFVFKVGLDATFKPYGFKDANGEIVGFDIDLAKEVAKRRGWKLELKSIDWDAKDAELSSGMINCIWNGFTINGREKQYTWTEAYVDCSQVVMVRKDAGIAKLADLAGKVVVVQKDSSGAAALNEKENEALKKTLKAVRAVPEFNTAMMELETGTCDAVVIDQGVAEMHLKEKAGKFAILAEALKSEQYGVGFKLGDTALRDAVQSTFKEMVKDGTAAKISAKWFDGKNVCVMKP